MQPGDWVVDLVGCAGVLALWGLGLRRRLIDRTFWRGFLFIGIATFIGWFTLDPHIRKYTPPVMLLALTFYTAQFLGMYLYAFRSDDLWDSKEQASADKVTATNDPPRRRGV
jgi:hypothetical protein